MLFSVILFTLAFFWLAYETRWFTVRLAVGATDQPKRLQLTAKQPVFSDRPVHRITTRAWRTGFVVVSLVLILASFSPMILRYLVFRMPGPSTAFDCDDSTLLMLDRLSNMGISATPVLGNLKETNETYVESDHVWLIAHVADLYIVLDWGTLGFGKQYYEGYEISRSDLLGFVEQDRQASVTDSIPGQPPN